MSCPYLALTGKLGEVMMNKRLRSDGAITNESEGGDSCLVPPFFASRTLAHPECMVSYQSRFSRFVQGPPLFTRCMVSCHMACAPPFSARIELPACSNTRSGSPI